MNIYKFKYFAMVLAAAAIVGLGLAGCSSSSDPAAPSTTRTTQFGQISGITEPNNAGLSWVGVPYAKPPVGTLRWQPPQDPDAWSGTLKTQAVANGCAQVGELYGPPGPGATFATLSDTFYTVVGTEDCLYLNIHRPATTENLPVLVYIHGGSNRVGGIADPLLYGTNLAKNANVVVVTVQYRLNLLGWLTHPALKTGDPANDSGNYGLLDLVQALKFVKNNIANFGGDPANVTITGQSAGAANVNALVVSPIAKGLFHKAWPISGGLSTASVTAGTNKANALIDAFLIKDKLAADAASAATFRLAQSNNWLRFYLMSKTTKDIIGIQLDATGGKYGNGTYTALGSCVANVGDGYTLPADYAGAVTSGNFNNVPIWMSHMSEEGKLFASGAYKISTAERFAMMMKFDPNAPGTLSLTDILDPAVLNPPTAANYNTYSYDNANHVVPGPAISTVAYIASVDATTQRYKTVQDQVYASSFNWAQQPEPWKTIYGAVHAGDLPFIFGNFGRTGDSFFICGFSTANEPGRLALANVMQKSIAAFVRTGNPNNASLGVTWEKATNGANGLPKKVVLDADYTTLKISTMNN